MAPFYMLLPGRNKFPTSENKSKESPEADALAVLKNIRSEMRSFVLKVPVFRGNTFQTGLV